MTIDGVPTLVQREPLAGGFAGIGRQVSNEDLETMGEEPLKFPVCQYPGCKGEGSYQIISGAGKPLSINRKGELVFGTPPEIIEQRMTPADKARLRAGLIGVIGPGIGVATQAPRTHVDVCQIHQTLPHAPKKPSKRYESGPYDSFVSAAARAQRVSARTREEAKLRSVKVDGKDQFYVQGDDGWLGYKGKLVQLP